MKSIKSKENVLPKVVSALRSFLLGWLNVAAGAVFGRCCYEFWKTLCRVVVVRVSTMSSRMQRHFKVSGLKGCFFVKTKCKCSVTSKRGKHRPWSRREVLPWVVKQGTILQLLPIPNMAQKKTVIKAWNGQGVWPAYVEFLLWILF